MEGNFKDDLPAMEGQAAQQRSDDPTFDDDEYEPNANSESAGGHAPAHGRRGTGIGEDLGTRIVPAGEPDEYAPSH